MICYLRTENQKKKSPYPAAQTYANKYMKDHIIELQRLRLNLFYDSSSQLHTQLK